ncbi:hypothetical protein RFI_14741, partial [Reticulomyxa filosa]
SIGLHGTYLKVVPTDEQHEYVPKIKQQKLEVEDKYLKRLMKDVQVYMKTRIEKAGVEGIRMYDLGQFIQQKFPTFDHFVHLTPGLVVLQMEDGSGNLDRVAFTEAVARKINLKQKLEVCVCVFFFFCLSFIFHH